jgi:Tfp pilus assembly protein PilE
MQMKRFRGFTLAEALITCSIAALLAMTALVSVLEYHHRANAHACRAQQQLLYFSVLEYASDHGLSYGDTVALTNMIPTYWHQPSSGVCPACNQPFGTMFTVGVVPTCPAGETDHVWKPDEEPGL